MIRKILVDGMQIRARHAFAGLIIAAAMILFGAFSLNQVHELAERTEYAMATYTAGNLTFLTSDGLKFTNPRQDRCKFRSARPENKCLAYFRDGDKVVVTYDSSDPTHTWLGPTPGGFTAVAYLWGGVGVGIFASLWLVFTSKWYQKLSHAIAGYKPKNSDSSK